MKWIKNSEKSPSDIYDWTSDRESEGYYLVFFDDCMGYHHESFQMCRWDGAGWRTPYLNMIILFWLKLPELPDSA